MPKSQDLREEADKTEQESSDKAEKLRDAADKQETAEQADKEAHDS